MKEKERPKAKNDQEASNVQEISTLLSQPRHQHLPLRLRRRLLRLRGRHHLRQRQVQVQLQRVPRRHQLPGGRGLLPGMIYVLLF